MIFREVVMIQVGYIPYGEESIGFGATSIQVGRFWLHVLVDTPIEKSPHTFRDKGKMKIIDDEPHVLHANGVTNAHVSCFGDSQYVEATPENICKAIQWCKENQEF